MSNVNFNDLSELDCPLLEQPNEQMCIGELVRLLAFNTALLERALLSSVIPAGMAFSFAGDLADRPKGFIVADGSWYQPTTYPNLFAVLQYRYGRRTDGCFRVPDYRGTELVGVDLGLGCLTGLDNWRGFTKEGELVNGGSVGASNKHCNNTDTESCSSTVRKSLVTPLISTGELCL